MPDQPQQRHQWSSSQELAMCAGEDLNGSTPGETREPLWWEKHNDDDDDDDGSGAKTRAGSASPSPSGYEGDLDV